MRARPAPPLPLPAPPSHLPPSLPLPPRPPPCAGRHGSRHATKLKAPRRFASALKDALALGKATPLGARAAQWAADYIAEEEGQLGRLTPEGRLEHAGTAARLWARHEGALAAALASGRSLVFEATDKSRTKQSRDAGMGALLASANASLPAGLRGRLPAAAIHALPRRGAPPSPSDDPAAGASLFHVITPPHCPAPGSDARHFSKLRFFDSCAAYTEYKEAKPWLPRVHRFLENSTRPESSEANFLRQLFAPDYVAALAQSNEAESAKRREKWRRAEEEERRREGAGAAGEGGAQQQQSPIFNMRAAAPVAKMAGTPSALPARRATSAAGQRKVRKLSQKVQRLLKRLVDVRKEAEAEGGGSSGGGGGGGGGKQQQFPHLSDLLSSAYDMCVVEQDALGRGDRWCSLFHGPHLETLAKYELLHDVEDYWKQGAGDPLAFAASCVLLEDMIEAGDWGAGLGGSGGGARGSQRGPVGHFRFGHSETVMPMLSLLGLWQSPGEPAIEEHYVASLSGGTRALLNSTRERLRDLQDEYPGLALGTVDLEALAPRELFSRQGRGGRGGGGGGGGEGGARRLPPSPKAWPLGAAAAASAAPAGMPPSRPLPEGFSEPLLMALKHPWAGARLVPMAANVQWEMWDCGEEEAGAAAGAAAAAAGGAQAQAQAQPMRGLWVRMLHNEREVPFPACSASALGQSPADAAGSQGSQGARSWTEPSDNIAAAPWGLRFPCPWDTVKRHYREVVYGRHGIGTCDASTWEEMCGGLVFAGEGCSDEGEEE